MQTRLTICQEVESTQDVAKKMALCGEAEGFAVMAFKQTGGRGRSGRTWISPAGKNLALSLLLRPRLASNVMPLLSLMTAIAVANTVERLGISRPELKWPNDVLVSGKKLAGILAEAGIMNDSFKYVILGIGLNVNSEINDFPPELHDSVTSLFMSTSRQWDLGNVAEELLKDMEDFYKRLRTEGPGFVPALWSDRWAHPGRSFTYNGAVGVGQGISSDGSLILKTDNEQVIHVASGIVDPI